VGSVRGRIVKSATVLGDAFVVFILVGFSGAMAIRIEERCEEGNAQGAFKSLHNPPVVEARSKSNATRLRGIAPVVKKCC
jgi:hypothetical protein